MNVAILIIQQMLDDNPELANINVFLGSIYSRSNLPFRWNGVNNYRNPNNSALHYSDGWRPVVTPEFDENTHYLGMIFLTGTPPDDFYTYPVVGYTQAELDAIARKNYRKGKAVEIEGGAQVVNNGSTFFFSKQDWIDFALITDNSTGNIKWFDVENNEVTLTTAKQNQINAAIAAFYLEIINR